MTVELTKSNHYRIETFYADTDDEATSAVIFNQATHEGRERINKHINWAAIHGHDMTFTRVD